MPSREAAENRGNASSRGNVPEWVFEDNFVGPADQAIGAHIPDTPLGPTWQVYENAEYELTGAGEVDVTVQGDTTYPRSGYDVGLSYIALEARVQVRATNCSFHLSYRCTNAGGATFSGWSIEFFNVGAVWTRLYKVTAGSYANVASVSSPVATPGATQILRVLMDRNGKHSIFIDGALALEYTDDSYSTQTFIQTMNNFDQESGGSHTLFESIKVAGL